MKSKSGLVVGIDLGTVFCLISLWGPSGFRIFLNLDGETQTQSLVNLSDESKPIVGMAARNQWAFMPKHTVSLYKRFMGKRDPNGNPIPAFSHPDSGREYLPEELSSYVIRYLIESVEAATGMKVEGAVISVPAYFDSDAKESTRRAGELAGVRVLAIINEPTAAGLALGLEKKQDGVFLIFDLGGGTFDTTILRIKNGMYEVLATDGDRDLGGADITNLIAAKAIEAFAKEHGVEITFDADPILFREVLDKAEMAKKTLSQSNKASFIISAEGKRLVFDIERDDFNALIDPIVQKTKAITERVLESSHLKLSEIDDVILVGGATRTPVFRDMLKDLSGKPARTDINPDEAVAMGAAVYAARVGSDVGLKLVDDKGVPTLPPPVIVHDVTSRPLGCLAQDNGIERNSVIIPANAKIPTECEQSFGLTRTTQTAARVTITSGEEGALPEDCKIYGVLILEGLPPGPVSVDRIKVRYRFNADGTLHVTITDSISGKSTSDIQRGFEGLIGPGSAS